MAGGVGPPNIEQLIGEHHGAVYRYAYRLTGSVPDAEDLCQQVFLTAHERSLQLRDGDKARSWLFSVLRNAFLKSCKKKEPILADNLEYQADHLPAGNPDDEWIDREQLQQAIAELPSVHRIVLLMYYFDDLSYREIAAELDLPIGTVMSRLARAKSHLRSRLFEEEESAAPPRGAGTPIEINAT